MIFVPVTRAQAGSLRAVGAAATDAPAESPWPGHAATRSLLAAHDYDATMAEDGEYAALSYAGLRCLTVGDDPLRLVLAAEVPDGDLEIDQDDPYGQVRVRRLRWPAVTALFADEPASAPAVAAARGAVLDRPARAEAAVAGILAKPAVEALLDGHELLWFAPEELDRLPS